MAKKTSGDRPATIAARVLGGGKVTPTQVRTLAGSVLSQDENRGKKGK